MSATIAKTWIASLVCSLIFAAAAVTLPGCQEALPQSNKDVKHPGVTVSYPVRQTVYDYDEFTGRVDAVNKVEVKAMVTGYLQDIKFKDGAEVKEDDVLFDIDPLVYTAKVHMAKSKLDQAKAHRDRLKGDFMRAGQANRSLQVVSEEDYKRIEGDLEEAKAAVEMAEAQLDQDEVNLRYTKVKSSINGKVSRRMIDRGNMVKANETTLTWLYQIDPMYGYFDVDERTVIKLRKLINDGSIKSFRDDVVEVDVGLAEDQGDYSLKGYIDWVDNVLDSGTGTLKIRCVIKQPRDKSGQPLVLVSPGMFVRVKMPTSVPRDTLLIAEKAIATDQGEKYVFVVNDENKIERRNVTLGQLHTVRVGQLQYNLRVVEKNPAEKGKDLQVTDKVVMSGLQRVHADSQVQPTLSPLPGGTTIPGLVADRNGPSANTKGSD
jgi:RND family efflux transporter MFP subunit